MSEHTPGPWHADHRGERIAIWALGDKRVFLGACCEREIGRRQAEANASLITAAPELLAACEAAYRFIIHHFDMGTEASQLAAAIAKARGQEGA